MPARHLLPRPVVRVEIAKSGESGIRLARCGALALALGDKICQRIAYRAGRGPVTILHGPPSAYGPLVDVINRQAQGPCITGMI